MIVVDTHVLIWAMQGDAKLGSRAAEAIQQAAVGSRVLVPAICAWEVALVDRSGKVQLPGGAARWMKAALATRGFALAPLEPEIAIDSVRLDWSHRDPADRMIVATARFHDAMLLTADAAILAYAAKGELTAIDAQ